MTTFGEVTAGLAYETRNPPGIEETPAKLPRNSADLTGAAIRRPCDMAKDADRTDQEPAARRWSS